MLIPTVAVLIIKKDQVLLVKHGAKALHVNSIIGLPSGHIEKGEMDIAAAVRELKEETGLDTTENGLLEFPNNYYIARIPLKDGGKKEYGWKVYFCKNYSGDLRGSEETTPLWVKINELDSLSLLPNVKEAVMAGLKYIKQQL